jgi:phage host-nuclease inhibitor protein Gam
MNRNEFVEKLKAQLDDINADLDNLEAKVNDARADVKEEYQEKLHEAKEARVIAETKLQKLRDAGEDAWEEMKAEAEHTWKALRNSVNYFKSHFK